MNIKRLFLVYVLLAHGLPLDSIILPVCRYRFFIPRSPPKAQAIAFPSARTWEELFACFHEINDSVDSSAFCETKEHILVYYREKNECILCMTLQEVSAANNKFRRLFDEDPFQLGRNLTKKYKGSLSFLLFHENNNSMFDDFQVLFVRFAAEGVSYKLYKNRLLDQYYIA